MVTVPHAGQVSAETETVLPHSPTTVFLPLLRAEADSHLLELPSGNRALGFTYGNGMDPYHAWPKAAQAQFPTVHRTPRPFTKRVELRPLALDFTGP